MAPEEFVHGATVDERTTVFYLGRTSEQLLGRARLSADQHEVVEAATQDRPESRFETVTAMPAAWRSASRR